MTDLELYSHHVQRGRAGQDGGVGPQKARQRRATVPEEQRVPGQEAGAEVRLAHQHGNLGGKKTVYQFFTSFNYFLPLEKEQPYVVC